MSSAIPWAKSLISENISSIFTWTKLPAQDKPKGGHHEWGAFQMDCQNIFEGTYSAMDKAERSATVLNWMG